MKRGQEERNDKAEILNLNMKKRNLHDKAYTSSNNLGTTANAVVIGPESRHPDPRPHAQAAGRQGAELFQAISWVSRVLDFEVLVMRRARNPGNCFIEFTEKNNSSPVQFQTSVY